MPSMRFGSLGRPALLQTVLRDRSRLRTCAAVNERVSDALHGVR